MNKELNAKGSTSRLIGRAIICWTALVSCVWVWSIFWSSGKYTEAVSNSDRAAAQLGWWMGSAIFFLVWFCPTCVGLVISFVLKKQQ